MRLGGCGALLGERIFLDSTEEFFFLSPYTPYTQYVEISFPLRLEKQKGDSRYNKIRLVEYRHFFKSRLVSVSLIEGLDWLNFKGSSLIVAPHLFT